MNEYSLEELYDIFSKHSEEYHSEHPEEFNLPEAFKTIILEIVKLKLENESE